MTVDDVKLADNIVGPDIGALKGKSTRINPKPVTYDVLEIPPDLIEQHN